MSFAEFCYRLTGLGEKTPLMLIAHVRTEDDAKVMKHWPDKLKAINNEWKVKQYNNITPQELERHKEIEQKRLQRFFEACAK